MRNSDTFSIIFCHFLQTFLAVLFGSFSLAQAGPYFADFASARGAAFAIWEVIDQVSKVKDIFSVLLSCGHMLSIEDL